MTKLQTILGTGVILTLVLFANSLLADQLGTGHGERRIAFLDGNGDGVIEEQDLRIFLAERDTDKNSTLSLEEFVVGARPDHLSRVERAFKALDGNSDGEVDWDELSYEAGEGRLAFEAKVRSRLGALDTDANGLLSMVEYVAGAPTEPKRDAKADFQRFDLDRDSQLSIVELCRSMTQSSWCEPGRRLDKGR